MDTTDPPPPAFVCDARSPLRGGGRIAWRRVTFLDGSGRGDVDDWLAVGGAEDASRSAPLLAHLGPRRLFFLDGSRAVALPPCGRWGGGAAWPVAWAVSRYGAGMAGAAAFYGGMRERAAVARAALAVSGLKTLRPGAHRAAAASIERGGIDGAAMSASEGRPRCGSARDYALRCAWGAVVCASALDRVRSSHAAADAFRYAVTARAVAAHVDDRPREAAARFQAEAADALRVALPWHELLERLVEASALPPPKAGDIGGRHSPGLLRVDRTGSPFEDLGGR